LSLSGASSSPSGNVSYAWSTTNGKIDSDLTGANITISAGGNYDLTVTDMTNGCTDEETVAVGEDTTPPFGQITQPPPLTCDSVSVQLQVLPPTNQPIYTFNWEGPGTIGNPDTPTPTVDKPGIYSVTITDITNGCESDTSIVVLQNIGPPTALAQTIGQLDCDDLTATVSGEGSSAGHVIYRWTTTSNGHIATPNALTSLVDAPGNYTLMVTDLDNGCTAEATTTVSAHSLPIDSVALSFDQPDCLNPEGFLFIDSVLGGTPPYTYSLNDSIFVLYPRFSYLDPGAYSLLVEDANGCSWETAISILLPNEVQVELGNDIFIEPGQNADLLAQVNLTPDEIASVVWTNLPDSVDCPQCLNQIVSPAETTTYHIEVFDSTGCFASDAVTVFVNNQQPFFVPSAFTPNGDNVNDLLIFYAHPGIEKVPSFSIYDRWGNRVFHLENFEPNNPYFGWDGNFNGQPMNPAVFAWKAIVEFSNGKRKAFYGDLTLVR
ncbi:MAG TPA: gliding motility-associated C-terminal domain-containing protein, partial [Bacteroidetes bacterium]|nr:gliding motility-associated C-terminal domain-containing protein [Bacteroidota bacterium]